jgi:hypothetical protein
MYWQAGPWDSLGQLFAGLYSGTLILNLLKREKTYED